MKRLAVLSAVHTAQLLNSNGNSTSSPPREVIHTYGMSGPGRSGRFETDLHGNVNILLGGAMLGGVIVVVVLVCYCCHRNMRKNRPHEYSQYWRPEQPGDVHHSLEVFTMDSHAMQQCYERNALSLQYPHHHHHHHHHHQQLSDEVASLPARPLTPGPPPAYESLIFKQSLTAASPSDKKPGGGLTLSPTACIFPVPIEVSGGTTTTTTTTTAAMMMSSQQVRAAAATNNKEEESLRDDEGLPTYEAALKLEAHGYTFNDMVR